MNETASKYHHVVYQFYALRSSDMQWSE